MRNGRLRPLVVGLILAVLFAMAPAHAGKKRAYDDLPDQELYELAVDRIDKGSFYKARQMLERLLRRVDLDPALVPLVQLSLADAYYGKKGLLNVTEAMSRYSNFLTFYPTHARADYAQYRLALCHFQQVYAADRDQRETRTAIEEFRRVQGLYPDSPYVDLAAEKIQEGGDLLADHEYRVGKFYFERKAYLGASDRFLTILDRYPRYPDKDQLYYYLGYSLMGLERAEEGEVYLLKLMETYPKSEYTKKARLLLPKGPTPVKNRYAMVEPGDSLLDQVRKRLLYPEHSRFPRTVQIQTRTGCNADCIWCPYGETFPTQAKGVMEQGLFERIIEECARHRVRRLSPYLMNEPFLDRDLPKKIRFMAENCPSAKVVVTSNGSMLRPDVVKEVLDLGPALHSLYISFQGMEKGSYEKTMRGAMKFDQTLENVHHLVDEIKRRNARYPEVWITMVDTNVIDAKEAVKYWQSRGVRSKYTTLENRGGNIEGASAIAHTEMDYYTTCTRLMKQAYILFNGDMVICCTDYSRQMVLGNMADSSVADVWNGETAKAFRSAYLGHRFDELVLCKDCKVDRVKEIEFLPWKTPEITN